MTEVDPMRVFELCADINHAFLRCHRLTSGTVAFTRLSPPTFSIYGDRYGTRAYDLGEGIPQVAMNWYGKIDLICPVPGASFEVAREQHAAPPRLLPTAYVVLETPPNEIAAALANVNALLGEFERLPVGPDVLRPPPGLSSGTPAMTLTTRVCRMARDGAICLLLDFAESERRDAATGGVPVQEERLQV